MAKYNKPVFVNELLSDKTVKTASKFIAYKTWDDPSLWLAEVIDGGNAFFHWHQRQRDKGHKDSIIRYITADGTKWEATIQDFVYFHSPNGDNMNAAVKTFANGSQNMPKKNYTLYNAVTNKSVGLAHSGPPVNMQSRKRLHVYRPPRPIFST
jgi:hypothetical protein